MAGSVSASTRAGVGRSLDGEAGATVDEQVEVDLARPPAPARLTTERSLHGLELREQFQGPARGVRGGRNVQGDDGVRGTRAGPCRRLVLSVKARDAAESCAGECRERVDRLGQRGLGVAEVRPRPM